MNPGLNGSYALQCLEHSNARSKYEMEKYAMVGFYLGLPHIQLLMIQLGLVSFQNNSKFAASYWKDGYLLPPVKVSFNYM